MIINENLTIVGEKLTLVPYKEKHVERYHKWMSNADILELTASEALSLEEEYAMQKSWHKDADKLTFILVDSAIKDYRLLDGEEREEHGQPIGDVNIFLNEDDDIDIAECEIMIAEPTHRWRGFATEALTLLLGYYTQHVDNTQKRILSVKISYNNKPSLKLFTKMGFVEHKRVEVFQEVELRCLEVEKYKNVRLCMQNYI
ncbi:acyl-CoA N-acyltransferase [Wallemia mellicola]|uniref:Acyl-CoA N-acyltransferase n=2 Tax=Wallemia mellicola TaxID=1708541 RepID=A0A4T0R174_9BASI|nr:acyl-CoA N-acyltransferase [Wallemia mellicola]TIC31422.1 acyl-CoA N-acyltransferase [Wallemia mellicola]